MNTIISRSFRTLAAGAILSALQRAAARTARASAPSNRGRACETDLPFIESYLYGTVRKVIQRRLWTRVDNMTINKPNSIMA